MTSPDHWAQTFEALTNPYRRELLVALLEHNPQDDDDRDPLDVETTTGEEPAVLETELVHNHLPKLEDMGFIEWNRGTNKINRGPNWDDIAPILELIEKHKDELPEGWL